MGRKLENLQENSAGNVQLYRFSNFPGREKVSERGWRNISLTLNQAKFSTRGTRFKVHQSLCQALFSYYYYFFFAYRLTNKTGKHLSSLPSLNQPDSFAKALPRRRSKLKVAQLWQKKSKKNPQKQQQNALRKCE